ncbi:hypothetical protein CHLNCDRAFT_143178 [Chlorella variabilis]|uniref:Uncharacterized protein n=1 Tax=Chlorella variabilis TaxID=554065 RepID=E1Z9M7_CHLVA|nr:hypothetical protein CHLNCDRAFT_143178 [Chlorella variabilis]EFN57547.1 hypothetical protein CHLNCDRAFT_143178 [Chlorella variabilis]|eukprot:XP_005849649.1 hypothetical protein CHLNCDRAFT_143178 [Chlorella variabilis]
MQLPWQPHAAWPAAAAAQSHWQVLGQLPGLAAAPAAPVTNAAATPALVPAQHQQHQHCQMQLDQLISRVEAERMKALVETLVLHWLAQARQQAAAELASAQQAAASMLQACAEMQAAATLAALPSL